MVDLDKKNFLILLEQLYEAATDAARWPIFLGTLAETFRSQCGALLLQDVRESKVGFVIQTGLDQSYINSYVERYKDLNPWQPHMASLAAGSVSTDEPVMSVDELSRTEFYNEWLRPQHLLHALGGNVVNDRHGTMQITMMRSGRMCPFTENEIRFLDDLLPHVRRAVQIHRQLFSVQGQRGAAMQALSALSVGLIICDAESHILFANEVAEGILSKGECLSSSGGRVRGVTADATQALALAIKRAVDTSRGRGCDSGGVMGMPTLAGKRVPVLLSPFRSSTDMLTLGCSTALLFISEPSTSASSMEADLARLYGLTPAEARLTSALLKGQAVSEYAEARGLSAGTARIQLKRVFAKTGASRQSDLIREILGNAVLQMRDI